MKRWRLLLIVLFCAAVSFAGFMSNYPGLGPGETLPPGLILISPILESPVILPSATPPANPRIGTLWFDSSADQIKVWNGQAWVSLGGGVIISDTPPPNPPSAQLWFNSRDLQTYIFYNGAWVVVINRGAPVPPSGIGELSLTPSAVPPTPATEGEIYYDSHVHGLKVYNGTKWQTVQAN